MDVKIIVATHKAYWMPNDNSYLPLHVGSEGKRELGYVGDNTGDNISVLNSSFCELTGLYWLWKNCDSEYKGVVHYRRYFTSAGLRLTIQQKRNHILTSKEWSQLLEKAPIVLPKKRNYWIETTRSQYKHAHNPHDLVVTEDLLKEKYPTYHKSWDKVMNSTKGHRFNMFVMRSDILDEYCEWLFEVLFEIQRRIDISSYSSYNTRVFGFLSERLLDVWLLTKGYSYVEQDVTYMENQNWIKKGWAFLRRKILGGVDFERE
ncbi:MAG: DUF4422 domain-containing protein [Marinilabiliaceae bacterium]|nr:DUF4422 domain-containing protein [Marinilabiliaceae bacterium]